MQLKSIKLILYNILAMSNESKVIKNISIIIPIYNEESFLNRQITQLISDLKHIHSIHYEILLIENGSTDNTLETAQLLAKNHNSILVLQLPDASYGLAIKEGIKRATYNTLVQFDIDLIDLEFLNKALIEINQYDIVVGSKLHKNSKDNRPLPRILLSKMINFLIRTLLHYRGTDTHGIKVYRKTKVFPLIKIIKESNHFFDTEILLQAQKAGLRIAELPINCAEMRQTRFPTTLRISQAFKEFWYLIIKYA